MNNSESASNAPHPPDRERELELPGPPTIHYQPSTIQVLFEDHHLLVVNKPAPLLTQAPPGVPSLEAMAKAYIKTKYQKPAGVYLGIPHRLVLVAPVVIVLYAGSMWLASPSLRGEMKEAFDLVRRRGERGPAM